MSPLRLTAAAILATGVAAGEISKYGAFLTPISGTDSKVFGEVYIEVSEDGKVTARGAAGHLEPSLSVKGGDCTAKNGCGVHIHAGDSCADATSQGGHFFSTDSDPWGNVVYDHTDAKGSAAWKFDVDIERSDVDGKAFIVHGNDGGRVACGILASKHLPGF